MAIQLKPGDYVSTAGMTEEQYHAVARAFMDAGADKGEYPSPHWVKTYDCLGWCSPRGGVWHQQKELDYFTGRQLTLDQILGTSEPEWNSEIRAFGTLPPVGTVCEVTHAGMPEVWEAVEVLTGLTYDERDESSPRLGLRTVEGRGAHRGGEFWFMGNAADPDVKFRPIRTEENRAVEAMLSVVERSHGHYTLDGPMAEAMQKLYRAGYRKTGDPK